MGGRNCGHRNRDGCAPVNVATGTVARQSTSQPGRLRASQRRNRDGCAPVNVATGTVARQSTSQPGRLRSSQHRNPSRSLPNKRTRTQAGVIVPTVACYSWSVLLQRHKVFTELHREGLCGPLCILCFSVVKALSKAFI